MRYEIEIRKRAEKDLASLPKADVQRIVDALFLLEDGLTGDIKKLASALPEYRLRIGVWRVLFEIVGRKIIIYRILHRKEAYR
ncbi:MAG: type II toxin-antitoxin system RelE/ParE family toxin [Nitrospira sp.]|nr:type II toxin-antitoxin system RelE/ParE family toxin [Nitrospira sp.]